MSHVNYSNPRMRAVIDDWPFGSRLRTAATFEIDVSRTGRERATRVVIDPRSGKPCAKKSLVWSRGSRILDGDDGKTYIANLTEFGHISVFHGDMKYSHEAIFENNPRYTAILALFN